MHEAETQSKVNDALVGCVLVVLAIDNCFLIHACRDMNMPDTRRRVPATRALQPKLKFMVDSFPAESRSEEHTSELQSLMRLSYAVFCLKKKQIYSNLPNQHYNAS